MDPGRVARMHVGAAMHPHQASLRGQSPVAGKLNGFRIPVGNVPVDGLSLGPDHQRSRESGDRGLIDGLLVNGSWKTVGWVAGVVRWFQSGYIFQYALVMILGVFVLMSYFVFGPAK